VKKEGSVNNQLLDVLTTNKFLPFVTDNEFAIGILSGVFKPHQPRGTGSGTNSIDEHAKKEAEDNRKKQLEDEEQLYPPGFCQHQTSSRQATAAARAKRLEEEERQANSNISGRGISRKLKLEMVDKITGLTTHSFSSTLNKEMEEKLVKFGLSGTLSTAQSHLRKYIKEAKLHLYAPINMYNKIARLSIVTENVPMTLAG
jgi:hypothetical protein